MTQSYLQKVADELADLALADQAASGDVGIVDAIGELLGASSQSLQETYSTSIRVRRAEARAREMLAQRKASNYAGVQKTEDKPFEGLKEMPKPLKKPQEADAEADADTSTPAAEEIAPEPKAPSMPRRVTR